MIVSSNLHVYVSQTAKGELVIGSEVDPYQTYCTRSTLPTLEQMATYTLELFPQLHGVKILRQWAGVCDMTPDYAPIMGAAVRTGQLLYGCRLGHLGIQGRSCCRQVRGGDHCHRRSPRP